ncbi:hypothetical protein QL285_094599 [Trifolium repens]|nr:hypothetical protein QL285_094599 [Trifolium repens]
MGVNRDELVECDLLANSIVEQGLACMLGQELVFTSIVELLYKGVLLRQTSGWRLRSYPLGRGKTCSLLAGRLRLRRRKEARFLWRRGD